MARSPVTAVVVTHDAASFISATLRSLLDDPSGPEEIVVVDSGSSDATAAVVATFPVRWHSLGQNLGFGAAAGAGVDLAGQEFVAVLNHDVTVNPGWLPPLVAALDDAATGAAMATIELADRPGHFNTSGGRMTVSGMAWITDHGKPTDEGDPVEIPFPSGAAFAMRRSVWNRMGGMRPDFFLYHEDTDLGWRLRLQGLRIVRVPGSRVHHAYEFGRTAAKLRLLERNRWLMLLTNYRRSTLALLAPVLFLQECGVLWVAMRDGWLGAKLGTWGEVVSRRASTRDRYRSVQASRTVGDAAVLAAATGRIAEVEIPGVRVPAGAGLVDRFTHWWVGIIGPSVARVDRRHHLPS